jgi:hypothetical protein
MRTFIPKLLFTVLTCCYIASAMATDSETAAVIETTTFNNNSVRPDSVQMEQELQKLNWQQFRSVIESVPKLKADVDAYGPFGWQYVKANYTTYGWKKSIDRLDDTQKQELAELIRSAKGAQ